MIVSDWCCLWVSLLSRIFRFHSLWHRRANFLWNSQSDTLVSWCPVSVHSAERLQAVRTDLLLCSHKPGRGLSQRLPAGSSGTELWFSRISDLFVKAEVSQTSAVDVGLLARSLCSPWLQLCRSATMAPCPRRSVRSFWGGRTGMELTWSERARPSRERCVSASSK